jgi:hypothetical protein
MKLLIMQFFFPTSYDLIPPPLHSSQISSAYVTLFMSDTKFHTHTEPQAKL